MRFAGTHATLGIAHFNLRALGALRHVWSCRVHGVLEDALLPEVRAASVDCLDTLTPRSAFPRPGRGGPLRRGLAHLRRRSSPFGASIPLPDAEYVLHPFFRALAPPGTPTLLCCFDVHLLDFPEKYGRHRDSLLRRYAESVGRAGAVVVPFPRPFRLLPSLVPASAAKVFLTVCPTLLGDVPLSEDVLRAVTARFAPPSGHRLVLYPGQLNAHKNHVGLVEAAAQLVKRGMPVTFLCPGSEKSPELTARIREEVRSFGLEERFQLPGFLASEEVRALYELCDMAISPSQAEGGNAIVQEAIHFGKPVACAGIDAAREHARWIGAAVPFFDPDDPADMARAIERVLDDPTSHAARNRAAQETVRGWTWERLARRYAEILDWLLAGAERRARPSPDAC